MSVFATLARRRCRAVLLGSVLLLLVAVCQKDGPPYIVYVRGDSLVGALDSALYDCNAWDWGNKPIVYDWSCSRGRLAWDSVFRVKWYAPESSGPAVLKCTVTDLDNLTTTDSTAVRVLRVKKTLIDYGGAVKAGQFRELRDSLRLGYELEGRVTVDTPAISLLVLDDGNYQRWLGSQSYQALVERLRTRNDSFEAFVPASGTYHFVIDNTAENLGKEFGLFVTQTTP